MNGLFALIRDKFGVWAVDRAGEEHGRYRLTELEGLLEKGEVSPHTWLRHAITRKYSLVGEILFYNGRVSREQFEAWFPEPRTIARNGFTTR